VEASFQERQNDTVTESLLGTRKKVNFQSGQLAGYSRGGQPPPRGAISNKMTNLTVPLQAVRTRDVRSNLGGSLRFKGGGTPPLSCARFGTCDGPKHPPPSVRAHRGEWCLRKGGGFFLDPSATWEENSHGVFAFVFVL